MNCVTSLLSLCLSPAEMVRPNECPMISDEAFNTNSILTTVMTGTEEPTLLMDLMASCCLSMLPQTHIIPELENLYPLYGQFVFDPFSTKPRPISQLHYWKLTNVLVGSNIWWKV
ncbi:hypothetical protein PAMP_003397 [Pampus punctatissimus]